jgi:hypothetical protein
MRCVVRANTTLIIINTNNNSIAIAAAQILVPTLTRTSSLFVTPVAGSFGRDVTNNGVMRMRTLKGDQAAIGEGGAGADT